MLLDYTNNVFLYEIMKYFTTSVFRSRLKNKQRLASQYSYQTDGATILFLPDVDTERRSLRMKFKSEQAGPCHVARSIGPGISPQLHSSC